MNVIYVSYNNNNNYEVVNRIKEIFLSVKREMQTE